MSIEILAKQGRDRVYGGLAAIDSTKLRQMRDKALRDCFTRLEEVNYRMEFVARIHGLEFINDAAARSVNATWYTLERLEGGIVWIAFGGDDRTDYERLQMPVLRKVRMLICVGSNNQNLHNTFGSCVPTIRDVDTIGEAVHVARYSGFENVKVLFSPATRQGLSDECAGRIFSHEVNEL